MGYTSFINRLQNVIISKLKYFNEIKVSETSLFVRKYFLMIQKICLDLILKPKKAAAMMMRKCSKAYADLLFYTFQRMFDLKILSSWNAPKRESFRLKKSVCNMKNNLYGYVTRMVQDYNTKNSTLKFFMIAKRTIILIINASFHSS